MRGDLGKRQHPAMGLRWVRLGKVGAEMASAAFAASLGGDRNQMRGSKAVAEPLCHGTVRESVQKTPGLCQTIGITQKTDMIGHAAAQRDKPRGIGAGRARFRHEIEPWCRGRTGQMCQILGRSGGQHQRLGQTV